MEMSCPIGMVEETPRCVRLRWYTDDEMDQSLIEEAGILQWRGLCVSVVWDEKRADYTRLCKHAKSK